MIDYKLQIDTILNNLNKKKLSNRIVGSRLRSIFFQNGNPNKNMNNINEDQQKQLLKDLKDFKKKYV